MNDARWYQAKAMDEVKENFIKGIKKVLLWLATGGGKTFVFCRMIKMSAAKGRKCIVVVRGRKLVDQASKRLFREGVEHGVYMAGHWNFRPHLPIQVCSIDTLIRRKITPKDLPADFIVIDEAHLATSDEYKDFLAQYEGAFILGVTATPYTPKPLSHIAEAIVKPVSMTDLIDEGYLVPFDYYAPDIPDMSEVDSTGDDFKEDELEGVMEESPLVGSIVHHWKKFAKGRATIGFCVNISHSKFMRDRFIDAGIRAAHCDSDTPKDEVEEILKKLEDGEIDVVFNVGILCTGVDLPRVSCIIHARPTKSRNLFIQQLGRGTRLYEGKKDCMVLDHAGNILRLGFPTDEPSIDLEGKVVDSYAFKTKICTLCFGAFRASCCPKCQVETPTVQVSDSSIVEGKGKLKRITPDSFNPIEHYYKELKREQKSKNRKPIWVYQQLYNRYGDDAREFLPKWFINRQHGSPFKDSPFG